MSSYRDDMNDTAVASDLVISGLADTSESTAFSKDSVIESLMVMNEDAAVASMAILDRTIAVLTDVAVISDSTTGVRQNHQSVTETARATDLLYSIIPAQVLEDAAIGSDSMLYRTRTVVEDAAQAGDDAFSRGVSRQSVIETARAVDVMWNRVVSPVLDETAIGSDELIYREMAVLVDSAQATEQAYSRSIARQTTADTARATDRLFFRGIYSPVEDGASASDLVLDKVLGIVTEFAAVSDAVLHQRTTSQSIIDSARVSDSILLLVRDLVGESVGISEEWSANLHAAVVIDDVAAASDYVLDAYFSKIQVLQGTGIASDGLFDLLRASQSISDVAVAEDDVIQDGPAGQAWTADSDGWAMSRWAPLDFTEFSVIDGVLYGVGKRGVFALDGKSETIEAQIRTGLIDIGGGAASRLDGCYLEYQLNGAAYLDVTQTQHGKRETFTYKLPRKMAGELTSGRFETGRGLRSRHYEFSLRLQGTQGHINDWTMQALPSTRRLS